MKIKSIYHRIYADYFAPERMHEYRKVLAYAINKGYRIVSTIEYYDIVLSGRIDDSSRFIINRHDVDTDINRARQFFMIEKEFGVTSSYYFRLSTINIDLISEINAYGSEASYHYEEIATYCKKNKIMNRDIVIERMPEIQELFYRNYQQVKKATNAQMRSVAAHGDFINRMLGIYNQELLSNNIRERCGIEIEAYDPIIKEHSLSIADGLYPNLWKPIMPYDAIDCQATAINLLTHPRHWGAAPIINTIDNLTRITEGLRYSAIK